MLGRSLMMKASGRRLFIPAYVQDYLDRVTAADVAAGNTLGLELAVVDAFNICLQDMVADTSLGVSGGVLAQAASLIKATCAMQGARTLSGALVPLAADMPAPTNSNFTGLRYNRRTGLLGDGATTYLDTNYAGNADPQDNKHIAVYVTERGATNSLFRWYMGEAGMSVLGLTSQNKHYARVNDLDTSFPGNDLAETGMIGASRQTASNITVRLGNSSYNVSATSQLPDTRNHFIFRRNDSTIPGYSDARLNFYSIGSALDLALLDARISALSTAIQAAIAP